jgi:hypothetical protein
LPSGKEHHTITFTVTRPEGIDTGMKERVITIKLIGITVMDASPDKWEEE